MFNFPVRAVGSNIGLPQAGVLPQDLVEQSMTAYEVGYTGVIKQRATVSAALFFNETKDDIFFTQVASYRAANPPPRLAAGPPIPPPLGPIILEGLYCPPGFTPTAQRPCPFGVGNGLPAGFSYRNLGKVQQKGLELGIDGAIHQGVERVCQLLVPARSGGDRLPAVRDQPAAEQPLQRRRELRRRSRYLGNLAVSYQDEAYWQDVLDSRYSGFTDAFTLVNGTFGVKWGEQAEHRDDC